MRYLHFLFPLFVLYFSGCMIHSTPKPTPLLEANTTQELIFLHDIVDENVTAVQKSLEDGLNPNIQSQNISAIEFAIRRKNYEIIKLLLEHGANPLEKMSNFYLDITVAGYSSSLEDSRILKLMFEYGANAQNLNNFSTLSGAISKNRVENFNFLLENGFDVNARSKDADPILALSTYDPSHLKITEILLSKGADVNARNDENATILMSAITKGNSANVKLLLEHGVDVNHADLNGNTAVAKAVKFDNPQILKLLIEYDADITSKIYSKVTPLIIACVLDNYKSAKVIADAMKEKDGRYILIAYKYGDSKMLNFLLDNGFVVPNLTLGKPFINFYLANNRDKELQEYLSINEFKGFELRYISMKARARVSKIFDNLLLKNSFSDEQKLHISKNFEYVRDNKRAYKWMIQVDSKNIPVKFGCIISSNVGKTDISACQTYAKNLEKDGSNMRLSYIYLVLKEYDKSIKAAKISLKKDKKYYVYSNLGHSYLLKGERKKAYSAYKNYMKKLDSVSALLNIESDFEMLKYTYPKRVAEFEKAYEYSKKIDKEMMQKYMKQFK